MADPGRRIAPTLPFEIVSKCLSHFSPTPPSSRDVQTLRSASLVSKSWTQPAQRSLFRQFTYHPDLHSVDAVARLHRVLVDSPHLAEYFQSARIFLEVWTMFDAIPDVAYEESFHALLRLFPRVRTIQLAANGYQLGELPEVLLASLQSLVSSPSVTDLTLSGWIVKPPATDLVQLLSHCCCSLTRLTLDNYTDSRVSTEAQPPAQTVVTPITFEKLTHLKISESPPPLREDAFQMPRLVSYHRQMSQRGYHYGAAVFQPWIPAMLKEVTLSLIPDDEGDAGDFGSIMLWKGPVPNGEHTMETFRLIAAFANGESYSLGALTDFIGALPSTSLSRLEEMTLELQEEIDETSVPWSEPIHEQPIWALLHSRLASILDSSSFRRMEVTYSLSEPTCMKKSEEEKKRDDVCAKRTREGIIARLPTMEKKGILSVNIVHKI